MSAEFQPRPDVGRLYIVNEASKPALRETGRVKSAGSANENALFGVASTSTSADRDSAGRSTTHLKRPASVRLLRIAAGISTVAGLLAAATLLLSDVAPRFMTMVKDIVTIAPHARALLGHSPLSAMPLLLIGGSFITLQGLLRPAPMELVKRLLLGSAFVLWGIVQLMPPGALATDLGDLVIALYVLDLGLIIQSELRGV